MTREEYRRFEHNGLAIGFKPLLSFASKAGVPISAYGSMFLKTRFGVIHTDCTIDWSEPEDSARRYGMAAKYQPCGYPFAKCFRIDVPDFTVESLERIAVMVRDANTHLAKQLLGEKA